MGVAQCSCSPPRGSTVVGEWRSMLGEEPSAAPWQHQRQLPDKLVSADRWSRWCDTDELRCSRDDGIRPSVDFYYPALKSSSHCRLRGTGTNDTETNCGLHVGGGATVVTQRGIACCSTTTHRAWCRPASWTAVVGETRVACRNFWIQLCVC